MKQILLAATALTAMTAVASAADLPRRYAPPPPAAVYVPPAFTWTGFYVGAYAGGAVGGDFTANSVAPAAPVSASTRVAGFAAGGTVGYNYQLTPGNGLVLGVEGDIGYTDIGNRIRVGFPGGNASVKAETDSYLGTIRGRLGYAMGSWLFYATGGWAFTEAKLGAGATGLGSFSTTRSLDGYTVGAGVEYAITPAMSVKAEYLYMDFDKKRYAFPQLGTPAPVLNASPDVHLLKVGLNYKFNAF